MWATWCPPCRDSIPHVSALQKQFPNVCFIGMTDEKAAVARPFVEKMGSKMEYRCDTSLQWNCVFYVSNSRFSPHLFSLRSRHSSQRMHRHDAERVHFVHAGRRRARNSDRVCHQQGLCDGLKSLQESFAWISIFNRFPALFCVTQSSAQASRIVWSGHPSDAEFEAVLTRVQAEPGALMPTPYIRFGYIHNLLMQAPFHACNDSRRRRQRACAAHRRRADRAESQRAARNSRSPQCACRRLH